MRDKTGFFAGLADTLTAICIYYVVGGLLILSRARWGVHLVWLLAAAALWSLVFERFLRRPRSTAALTAVTGGMVAAGMALYILVSRTPLSFGYVFVLVIGAGMAAGLPLYHTLHRPPIHRHLTHLDVLIVALGIVLLARTALGIDGGTVWLMTAVLLMDAAGAVGLRMSDGERDTGGAFRGTLVALGAAAAVALLIGLFTALFSRSGTVTGRVVGGIGSFFAAIGNGLERFFRYLTSFIHVRESYEAVDLGDMPSVAALEHETVNDGFSVPAEAIGITAGIVVLVLAAAAVLLWRKRRFARETGMTVSASRLDVRRTGGAAGAMWQRLRRALRFRRSAFVHRDTPGGLMVELERLGRRRHRPRGKGESMRHYIRRMDASGGLDPLADALDREFYGGRTDAMSARECRAMRKYMKKAVQHG